MNRDRCGTAHLTSLFVAAFSTWSCHVIAADPPHPSPAPAQTLTWRTGEKLSGELVEGTANSLTWRSALFAEPLLLSSSALEEVAFPTAPASTEEPFRISLRDGSCLYGDVTGIDEKEMRVHSRQHGDLKLLRAEILRVLRLRGGSLIYAGPGGVGGGWRPANAKSGSERLSEAADAALTMNLWDQRLFLPLPLPDRFEIDIQLTSSSRLDFDLDFSALGPAKDKPRVEVWDDDLVAVMGDDFSRIKKMALSTHETALRILVDRAARRFVICDPSGNVLADWQTPSAIAVLPGIALHNKGRDLTLRSLRVAPWKGGVPAKIRPNEPRIQLIDGTVIYGSTICAAGADFAIKSSDDGSERVVSWKDVDALVGPPVDYQLQTSGMSEIWFADGGLVRGILTKIKDGQTWQETVFSREPVRSELGQARRMILNVPRKADEESFSAASLADTLTLGDVTFHGLWVGAGQGEIRWNLPGSLRPARPLFGSGLAFTRSNQADFPLPVPLAVMYLADGDVIQGRLRGIDGTSVGFDSEFAANATLPRSEVRAIHFAGQAITRGLADPGWRQVKGANDQVERTPERVTLQPGAAWGHPTILSGGNLEFTVGADEGYTTLRVRLFGKGTAEDPTSTNFVFGCFGNRIYCGKEGFRATFENQLQLGSNANATASIGFVFGEEEVELWVNGSRLRSYPVPADKRTGAGLVFEPCRMGSTGERPLYVTKVAVNPSRRAMLPPVADEARQQAITVPRFHKDSTPGEALVAVNGDVLRGEIASATDSDFSFRSGLETIRVPRQRVSAAIWLKKPEAAKPAARVPANDFHPTHWLLLANGVRLGMAVSRITDGAIEGQCRHLGECHVPMAMVTSLRTTPPEPDMAQRFFDGWQLQGAQEPVLPTDGDLAAPLLGQAASDFTLRMMDGTEFHLQDQKGKVVVLDFWATWCGPCTKALPELLEAMADFDASRVRLVGVNQAESTEVIRRFLSTRGWKLPTALDSDQTVARSYGVEGIPHTIVIGPDGKVIWSKNGYRPGGGKAVAEAVRKALGVGK